MSLSDIHRLKKEPTKLRSGIFVGRWCTIPLTRDEGDRKGGDAEASDKDEMLLNAVICWQKVRIGDWKKKMTWQFRRRVKRLSDIFASSAHSSSSLALALEWREVVWQSPLQKYHVHFNAYSLDSRSYSGYHDGYNAGTQTQPVNNFSESLQEYREICLVDDLRIFLSSLSNCYIYL